MTESHVWHEPSYEQRYAAGLAAAPARDRLIAFLSSRLTEELARIWPRESERSGSDIRSPGGRHRLRPGMAAQVGVVDDLLRTLGRGRLPARPDLRMLLYGYGGHPDYDPRWTALLQD